jgi:hypothetical protein
MSTVEPAPNAGVVFWSMPLSLFLGGMVFFYCLPLCCCYPFSFFLYWFEGRLANYFPTISETGTDYPNTEVIRFTLGNVGMITFFSLLLSLYYLEFIYRLSGIVRAIRWLMLIVASIGTIGVGCFSLATQHTAHFLCASTSFGSVCIFELIDVIVLFRSVPWRTTLNRIASLVIQVGALAIIGRAHGILDPRIHDTISGICEYTILSTMGWFYATFYGEFKGLELALFIAE